MSTKTGTKAATAPKTTQRVGGKFVSMKGLPNASGNKTRNHQDDQQDDHQDVAEHEPEHEPEHVQDEEQVEVIRSRRERIRIGDLPHDDNITEFKNEWQEEGPNDDFNTVFKKIPVDQIDENIDEDIDDFIDPNIYDETIQLMQPREEYWQTYKSPKPSEKLKQLILEQTVNKVELTGTESPVRGILNYNPEENTFLIDWHPTWQAAATIGTLDWCFVYACLIKLPPEQKLDSQTMKAAYEAWKEAREAMEIGPYRKYDQKKVLNYPKTPLLGFIHSLHHCKFSNKDIPQFALESMSERREKLEKKMKKIAMKLYQNERYNLNFAEKKVFQQYCGINKVLAQAKKNKQAEENEEVTEGEESE